MFLSFRVFTRRGRSGWFRLENDYIAISVLPEIGGRLFSAAQTQNAFAVHGLLSPSSWSDFKRASIENAVTRNVAS